MSQAPMRAGEGLHGLDKRELDCIDAQHCNKNSCMYCHVYLTLDFTSNLPRSSRSASVCLRRACSITCLALVLVTLLYDHRDIL